MQRSYSTFVMIRHAMSLSAFLEFSSNAFEFSFSILIISLTFRLAFLLLCVLSRISFKKLTTMKVQYPPIHTKQLTHPFPLILVMMMVVVSLQRMMRRKIQRLSYRGKILPMKCGKATKITWQIQELEIVTMNLQVLASSSSHQQINDRI